MTLISRARGVLPVVIFASLLAAPVVSTPQVAPRYEAGRPELAVEAFAGSRARLADTRPTVVTPSAPALPPLLAAPAPGHVTARPAAGRAPAVRTSPARAARTRIDTRRISRPHPRFDRGWEQRHGAAALDLITYPWQALGWQITFHEARPGILGLADEPGRHIYVFVRRNQSIPSLAFTVAHEIGHAFDFTYGTPERHARWRQLRGINPKLPWTGCEACDDLDTPAGDLAEVFAAWQVGPVDFRSRLAPLPPDDQLTALGREFGGP
ncbi:MAG TPA: hypothetical protein VNB94_03355 [Mycobacteriales bacterium]|nr:hypothetical protein [Mycobacteriales bacterium]